MHREFAVETIKSYLPVIFPNEECFLIDGGAYKGEFTQAVLTNFKPSSVVLVEANPNLISELKHKFGANLNPIVRVAHCALSPEKKKIEFNLYEDPATSSVLNYNTDLGFNLQEIILVPGKTLNEIASFATEPIFLKLDLQGLDLSILMSAEKLLVERVKVCVVEFSQYYFYEKQGETFEILILLNKLGFELFQITDLHSLKLGRLAFGNFIFVNKCCYPDIIEYENKFKVPCELVQNELFFSLFEEFKKAADERLQLVHILNKEMEMLRQVAQERLELMESTDLHIKSINKEMEMLRRVAQERLDLIETMGT